MSKVTYTTPNTYYAYFTNGQYADYYVGNDAWNVGGLVEGVGYSCSVTFDPDNFQSGTTFIWTYPQNVGGVYAYPDIGFDVPNASVGTTQVGNIASLSVNYSAALTNPTNSTLAFDLWFNSQPNGAWATTSDEVLIEVAPTSQGTPNQSFTITDSTITNASVYVSSASGAGATWKFIDIKTPTDVMSATLSISDIFKTLIWDGVLTGKEYLTAIQFGSEVQGGSGSLQVNSLGYSWTATPSLVGTSGNDTFVITSMGGNDVIGNGGVDTVVYSDSYSNYQIKSSGSEILITEGNNISTLDEVQGITYIQFSDGTYNVATGSFTSNAAAPSAPVIVSFSPDSGVRGDGITNATTLTLTGTGAANSTVTVFDGTTRLGTATVSANGAWNFTTGTLSNGTQSFTATDSNASGNTSAVSAALAVTIDTVAPAVSSVVASGSGITNGAGDLNAGHVVTLTVNLSEAVTVAGGTPTLTLNDGGTATYSGGSGSNALTFSYTVAAGQNTAALAVTAANLNSATVTDAAGNAAVLTAAVTNPVGTLQIDTTAPTAPVISSDSAAIGTAVNAVTLTGTAEANNLVTVYKGTSELGTVTANSAGAWSYTTGTLAAGTYTFTATATDAAGNVSAMSQPIDPTIGSSIYDTNNTSPTITDTNDTVILSGSNDTVNLTGSNDTIQLSGSNDQLTITGSGNSVNVSGSNDSVSATGAVMVTFSGSGTVAATIGSGATLNLADNLTGSGNDTLALTGNSGAVNLTQLAHFSGFSGVSLSGSNDTLTLTNANLTVTRLSGSGDTITLGTGIDTVAYTNVGQSTQSSHDTIVGFNASQDTIDFSAIGGLNSNAKHVTINFLTSAPNKIAGDTIDVVTSRGNTIIYTNATGSNENISGHQADMQINLIGVTAVHYSDFILHH